MAQSYVSSTQIVGIVWKLVELPYDRLGRLGRPHQFRFTSQDTTATLVSTAITGKEVNVLCK